MTEYKLGYTAGASLIVETLAVAEAYIEHQDWGKVKTLINEENAFQFRRTSASRRILAEVIYRLKQLNESQIEFLVQAAPHDQFHFIWYMLCKSYRLIKEFAIEVVREKFLQMNTHLTDDDYQVFYMNKSEWESKLEEVSDSTKYKLKQVLYKMLHELELVNSTGQIVMPFLSPNVIAMMKQDVDADLRIFPIPDHMMEGI